MLAFLGGFPCFFQKSKEKKIREIPGEGLVRFGGGTARAVPGEH